MGSLEETFDELIRQEGDGLFRFLYWALGHREDAHDATQEVMIRAWKGLPALRDQGSMKQWLYRIATNVGRTTHGKRRRVPKTMGGPVHDDDGVSLQVLLGGTPEARPEDNVEAAESDGRLARALEALTPELREPLLLHVVSGLKYREIAEALGWPMGTVTTRIHEARLRLKDAL